MTEYVCLNCAKMMDWDQIKERVRCPYCGYRIVEKARPKTVVKVPAK
jgi:DNA-directed RNA polymerase subunit RPC12/RpoP